MLNTAFAQHTKSSKTQSFHMASFLWTSTVKINIYIVRKAATLTFLKSAFISTTECHFLNHPFESCEVLIHLIFCSSQFRAVLDANNQESEGLFGDLPQHIKQSQDEGKKGSQVKWHIRAGVPGKKDGFL